VWRRAAVATALAGLWLLASGPAAGAHAVLTSSEPAAGASLDRAPAAVTLRFSEAPDPALSTVHVLDTAGHEVPAAAAPVAGDALALRVPLPGLRSGTWTVTWRATSRVDGHVAQGAFAFGVGLPAMATPAPNAGASRPALRGPGPLAVAGRWAFLWGVALLLGGAATGLLVFDRRLPARAPALLGAALALAAAGLVAMSIATAAGAGAPLGRFLASDTGRWLEARGAALLAAAVAAGGLLLAGPGRAEATRPGPAHHGAAAQEPVARSGPPLARGRAAAWLVALGVAASGALLVHALAGHAAAPGPWRPANLASQWVHLLAVGVWIGGLAWLLAGLAGGRREGVGRMAARFSLLATVGLAVVALSGLERAAQELGGWRHLLSTAFGRALDVKLGLLAVLLAFGAVNRFRIVPALTAGTGRPSWLRRAVRAEVLAAGGVLLAAAVLSELPPGADAGAPPPLRQPTGIEASGSDYATTMRVTLRVSPGSAGPNRFVATVADYDSGKPLPADRLQLSAALPSRPDVAAAQLDLRQAADGSWQGQGSVLTIAGSWTITALVERPDGGVTVPIALRIRAAPPR
jgi:copper transport protein